MPISTADADVYHSFLPMLMRLLPRHLLVVVVAAVVVVFG